MPPRSTTLLLPFAGSLVLALLTTACGGPAAPPRGLVVLPGSTSGAPAGQAPLERPYFHDFGAVALGERPEHTFELVNTDPEPVTIQRVVPSCSCTVPSIEVFAKDGRSLGAGDFFRAEGIATVPPGGKAALKLKIETNAVQVTNADKLVQVRLQSDSKTNPWLTLEAHLIVVQHLLATPGRIELGVVPVSAGSVVEVTVRPNQLLPDEQAPRYRLAGLESATAPLKVEIYPHPNQPDGAWLVLVDVPADQRQGPVIGEVRLSTEDKEGRPGPSLVLPVNGQIGPDFAVDPPRAFLRPGPDGGAASARLELISRLPGAPFRIASYELGPDADGDLKFEATPLEPNAEGLSTRWELIIRAYPDQKPPAGTLGVLLDGPRPARLEIPYEPYRQP